MSRAERAEDTAASGIRCSEGCLDGAAKRVGIVASRFHERLVRELVRGAVDCLREHGTPAANIHLVWVPGAWEIPHALEELAQAGGVDTLVALGIVIRGETPHFDFVAGEASRGCAAVASRHRLPVGFGLLTCDTPDQAAERAGGKVGNKGWEAAAAALELADLSARLRGTPAERPDQPSGPEGAPR